jgi:SAM-dependent methyltransferase
MASLQSDSPSHDLRTLVHGAILTPEFRRATFGGGGRRGAPSPWLRVTVRPVVIRDERCLQFSYFDGRKTITHNHDATAAVAALDELIALGFAGINLMTSIEEIDIRTTKKGKVILGRHAVNSPRPDDDDLVHNRVKDVPLPEGRANPLLEAMGILTRDGRVRPTMRGKFTQINEFLKHLQHVLADAGIESLGREVEILDCGCGSSYLTLAVHYFLNKVLNIPARILGVDVNEEVIRKSVSRAEHLGASGIDFQCGPIGSVETKADIVLALHACDTATDDALARAVRAEARLILSVPCCHHDLNRELRARGPIEVLRPILRHGILRERCADLLTDAFRALALRIMGYKTEVVEFVSPEHTARNLMIRAVRGASPGDEALVKEYLEMRNFCGIPPYIERSLGEPFQNLLGAYRSRP